MDRLELIFTIAILIFGLVGTFLVIKTIVESNKSFVHAEKAFFASIFGFIPIGALFFGIINLINKL